MDKARANTSEFSGRPSGTMRWLGIAVRTAHIATAAVFFGGCLLQVATGRLLAWHHLAIASGGLLLLLEWQHDRRWPHRGKGVLGIVHAGLAAVAHLQPSLIVPVLWAMLVTGCVGSHMPRFYRHWSVLYGPEMLDRKDRKR